MLSFIIPVYKTPLQLLRNCLDSVLRYSQPMELICVLDSPGDACEAVLDEYAQRESRIRLLKNDRNRGVSYSRNRGVDAARGEWLAFVDADDEIIAETYEKAVVLAEKEKVNACAVSAHRTPCDVSGTCYGKFVVSDLRDRLHGEHIANAYCWAVYPMVIRRKVWVCAVGGFVVGHRFGEDYMAVVKLLCTDGKYAFLNLMGYKCVGHDGSACRSKKSEDNYSHGLIAVLSVMRDVNKFGVSNGAMLWYLQHTIPLALFDPKVCIYVRGACREEYKKHLVEFLRICDAKCGNCIRAVPRLLMRTAAKFPALWFLPGMPFLVLMRGACHFKLMLKSPMLEK